MPTPDPTALVARLRAKTQTLAADLSDRGDAARDKERVGEAHTLWNLASDAQAIADGLDALAPAPAGEWNEAVEACAKAVVTRYGHLAHKQATIDAIRALKRPAALGDAWQLIETAKKNGEPVLLLLKNPIPADSERLRSWDGLQFVGRHPGVTKDTGFDIGWNFAAPVGHGGFPDDWIEGWQPLPRPAAQHEGTTDLLASMIGKDEAAIARPTAAQPREDGDSQ